MQRSKLGRWLILLSGRKTKLLETTPEEVSPWFLVAGEDVIDVSACILHCIIEIVNCKSELESATIVQVKAN